MDIEGIAQAIIAGLLGGAIVPYLSHRRERTVARAAVQKRLSDVERSRWARISGSELVDTEEDFNQALRAFQADAVAAALPLQVVELYIALAQVGYDTSLNSFGQIELDGETTYAAYLPGELSRVVDASRTVVTDAIWRPFFSRITRRWKVWLIRRTVDAMSASSELEVEWDYWFHAEAQRYTLRHIRHAYRDDLRNSKRMERMTPAEAIAVARQRKQKQAGETVPAVGDTPLTAEGDPSGR